MGGGGGGSSSSAQTTTTNTYNTDKRQVIDGGGFGVSTDGGGASLTSNTSTTTINTTVDSGSIAAGRDIALQGITSNANNIDHLMATADHLISQQQAGMQASMDLTRTLANGAQAAYSDAASQASGNKELILAAMAVVAVVAFKR